tara:strand:+ start:2361 stop:2663 length:303 start_codon:yes stop_codon:yes gene_type:complete
MSVLDKRIPVEGCEKDDKMYNAEGKELKPIQPRDAKELKQIEEMMAKYPQLDFLMCMLLLQAKKEELQEITNNPPERQLNTSCTIKQNFFPEEKPQTFDI